MNKRDTLADDKLARKAARTGLRARCRRRASSRWLRAHAAQRGRHAAITRNLYTWSNYKTWADKVRTYLGARRRSK